MLKKSRLSLVAALTLLAMAFMPQVTMASSMHMDGQQGSSQRMVAQQTFNHHPQHHHHHSWFHDNQQDFIPPVPPFPPFPPFPPIVLSVTPTPLIPVIPVTDCAAGVRSTYNTLIPGATTVNVVVDDPTFATATVSFYGVGNVLQTTGPLAIIGGVVTLTPPASLTLGSPTIALGVNTITIGATTYPLVSVGCA